MEKNEEVEGPSADVIVFSCHLWARIWFRHRFAALCIVVPYNSLCKELGKSNWKHSILRAPAKKVMMCQCANEFYCKANNYPFPLN